MLANVAHSDASISASNAQIGLSNSAVTPSGTGVTTGTVQVGGVVPTCSGAPGFPRAVISLARPSLAAPDPLVPRPRTYVFQHGR